MLSQLAREICPSLRLHFMLTNQSVNRMRTMNRISARCLFLCLLPWATTSAHAETEAMLLECRKSATFLAPIDSPDHRKYAPDREVEVMHLALDVTPDFQARAVSGRAVWQFKPLIRPLRELRLDAVDLHIVSVTGTEKIEAYQATDENL